MRKISLFLLLWLCLWCTSSSYAQQQWKWLNPKPAGGAGLSVKFTDPQTGYILNSDGQILKTTDQGVHWQIASQFNTAPSCMDIAYSTGVAGGYNGLLYVSSDNGNSWAQINTGITDQFNYVNVVSRDTFILGSNTPNGGVFYRTTDRGKTFTKSSLGQSISLNCMTFLDPRNGFAGSRSSGIYKTEDGGATWNQLLSSTYGPSGILALQFLNKDTGYASQEYSEILYTRDGGKTWKPSSSLYGSISSICIVGPSIAYAGGENGFMVKTVDGGDSWNYIAPNDEIRDGNTIYNMNFVSESTGFTVGLKGRIMKTTDAGATWSLYGITDIPVTAADFPTPGTGYITTWWNVYKTTDSGLSWSMLPLTVGTAYADNARFDQAHFVSADTGFVTSSSPTRVFNTVDGGKTWTQQTAAPYQYDYNAGISFQTRRSGYMTMTGGTSSTIVKTQDGGKTWSSVYVAGYQGEFFSRIASTDGETMYATRSYQLYKSVDSGKTWTVQSIGDYPYRLTDVCFTDPSTGFVLQEDGKIYVTRNGGATWDIQWPLMNYVGESDGVALKFFDRRVGYLVGGNSFGPGFYGYIFKTIDSGRTWQQAFNYGGTSISFTADSNVIVTGFGGEVIKSAVANYQIDSVAATFIDYPCTQQLTASAGAVYGRADSLSFEVTSPSGVVQFIAASPAFVQDGRVNCSALSDTAWTAGATYQVRFRMYYKGAWKYSNAVSFTAAGVPKPVITQDNGVLRSSAVTGNQWYLNGKAIQGATNNGWSPNGPGSYTVQSTETGCISKMSDPVVISGSWTVQSLYATPDTGCIVRFSAVLQVKDGTADSVSFEVTTPVLSVTSYPATPGKVISGSSTVTGSTNQLAPNGNYSLRLKLWFNGGYVYSAAFSFTLPPLAAPVITTNGNQLTSSYNWGNQWYLEGSAVPGANDVYFVPKQSGTYTVQTSSGLCVSPMSSVVKIDIDHPVVNSYPLGVASYPNPVHNQLTLVNTQNRSLMVEIFNFNGSLLYSARIGGGSTIIPTRQLSPGKYIAHLVDLVTGEKKSITFLKM